MTLGPKDIFEIAPDGSVPFSVKFEPYSWMMGGLTLLSIPASIALGGLGFVLCIAAIVICLIMLAKKYDIIWSYKNDLYFEHLKEFDKALLIKASKSPEISIESMRAINIYLNKNFAGWSVE